MQLFIYNKSFIRNILGYVLNKSRIISLTLVRSWMASKADLNGVLLASWNPETSTCSQKKENIWLFWPHLRRVACFPQIVYTCSFQRMTYFSHNAPQTWAAWSSPRVWGTCGPCLCLCELPQSGLADPQQKSAKNTKINMKTLTK